MARSFIGVPLNDGFLALFSCCYLNKSSWLAIDIGGSLLVVENCPPEYWVLYRCTLWRELLKLCDIVGDMNTGLLNFLAPCLWTFGELPFFRGDAFISSSIWVSTFFLISFSLTILLISSLSSISWFYFINFIFRNLRVRTSFLVYSPISSRSWADSSVLTDGAASVYLGGFLFKTSQPFWAFRIFFYISYVISSLISSIKLSCSLRTSGLLNLSLRIWGLSFES